VLLFQASLQTITGQCLDLITSPEDQINFDQFTPERYTAIVKWKTGFYSFYLPVALAMYMVNLLTHEVKILLLFNQHVYFKCNKNPKNINIIFYNKHMNKKDYIFFICMYKTHER